MTLIVVLRLNQGKLIQSCHRLRMHKDTVTAAQAMDNNFLPAVLLKCARAQNCYLNYQLKTDGTLQTPSVIPFLHIYIRNI